MRVAFYTPMKGPSSRAVSGDREMAANLRRALEIAGHDVETPSRFVSRDGSGDGCRQRRLAALGARLADRIVRRWRGAPPQAWLTYHVYHKSPDWLGPRVREALGVPYVVAEASHAPKRAGGRWDVGYRGAETAIRAADAVIGLSSDDAPCVLPLLADPGRYHRLAPFTDTRPFAEAAGRRRGSGGQAAAGRAPELLAVGMMRHGDKLASYRSLAAALGRLDDLDWTLRVVGDGPARGAVMAAFAGLPGGRVRWMGAVARGRLPALYAGADLMLWPAVNEAYGMALLEAQASGLPVVAGRAGGVPDIVRDGETGLLAEPGDIEALAAAARSLLGDAEGRRRMSRNALASAGPRHGIRAAARRLDAILAGLG